MPKSDNAAFTLAKVLLTFSRLAMGIVNVCMFLVNRQIVARLYPGPFEALPQHLHLSRVSPAAGVRHRPPAYRQRAVASRQKASTQNWYPIDFLLQLRRLPVYLRMTDRR